MNKLFETSELKGLELQNRVVMATWSIASNQER